MFNGDFYILVCGDRYWDDYTFIRNVIDDIEYRVRENEQMQLHVISGAQRDESKDGEDWIGADWLAIEACMELQVPFHGYPAQWELAKKRYGKNWRRAGIDRNAWQLRENRPRLNEGHAFHDSIDKSRGTKDMVDRMRKADLSVVLHAHS